MNDEQPELQTIGLGAAWIAVLGLGLAFVAWGGASLDLNATEARLGIATAERLGPYGQLFGRWDPSLWAGRIGVSKVFNGWNSEWPTSGAVRWPNVVAGLIIGVLLARRMAEVLGRGAAVWMALCWFGSLALMDHSSEFSLALFSGLRVGWTVECPDLVAGLMVIGAIDRILGRGADWIAGLWAAAAMLTGGWPGVLLIVLATLVIGRQGAMPGLRLLAPPILALTVWSVWALSTVDHRAWFAAMIGPLRTAPDGQRVLTVQNLVASAIVLGLPWTPLAVLAALSKVREGWTEASRKLIFGWLQAAAACLAIAAIPALLFGIAGAVEAAKAPILAGLAVVSASVAHRLSTVDWSYAGLPRVRWIALVSCALISASWLLVMAPLEFYLTLAVPYYRPVMIVLIVIGSGIAALTVMSLINHRVGYGLAALVLVAFAAKLTHNGYYVPEWNYRISQGPSGRAIGQWVPSRWPIYAIGVGSNKWSADLAFNTQRPFHQLEYPLHLKHQVGAGEDLPKFVLLHPAEFEHWPEDAPKLIEVRRFSDRMGPDIVRVLARTEGKPGWRNRLNSDD